MLGLLALAAELAVLRARGWGLGGRVVVRCSAGHTYTTIWIPGASVKSLRLGPWRVQRCPVGGHWSLVSPARRSMLSAQELESALGRHDLQVP